MAQYRAGVIGLGWMGMLYDLAARIPDRFDVDDVDRPTRRLMSTAPYATTSIRGTRGCPAPTVRALWDRPEVELVAAADRDGKRLTAFTQRYGIAAVYADAAEIRHRAAGHRCRCHQHQDACRPHLPRGRAWREGDRYRKADGPYPGAGRPDGHDVRRRRCSPELRRHQHHASPPSPRPRRWSRAAPLVMSSPSRPAAPAPSTRTGRTSWIAHRPGSLALATSRAGESGSDEFSGQGLMVTADGQVVHYRTGAPGVRITGSAGRDYLQLRAGLAALAARGRAGAQPARRDALAGTELHPLTAPSTRSMT